MSLASLVAALATRVADEFNSVRAEIATAVPTGGAAGQVLAKNSGTDYDTEWVDQSGGGTGVSTDTRVAWLTPVGGGSSSVDRLGIALLTAVGAVAAESVPDATSMFSSSRRVRYQAAASTTAVAGWVSSANFPYFRGASAGVGGFKIVQRFALGVGQTTGVGRTFVGLRGTNSAPTNATPSSYANIIGVGCDSADTQLYIMHNDGSGTATKIATGFTRPTTDNTNLYTVIVECDPNASTVDVTVRDENAGVDFSATLSTDLPSGTTGLFAQGWQSAGGTSTAVTIVFRGMYVETPY